MAKRSSKDSKVVAFGGWDLRGYLTRLTVQREHTSESRFPFGEAAESHQPTGISRGSIQQAGWFDDSEKGTIEAFIALENDKVAGLVNNTGGTQGSLSRIMNGVLVMDPGEQIGSGELVKWDQTFQVEGRIHIGQLAKPYSTITGNGNTSYDTGESATEDGAAIVIQVHDLDLGSASALVITVAEGDGSTWTTLRTFTISSDTVPYAEDYIETAAVDVGTHIKVSWAWTGGAGGGSTARPAVGVARLAAAA